MKPKSDITFTKDQRLEIKQALKSYFFDEMEIELTDLQTDFLLDFINEKMGKYFYNQGVSDTIKVIKERSEDLWLLLKE